MVCSWAGVAYKVVAVGGTKMAVVSIVRACRVHRERLRAGLERYNALCAIQGRRGECTRVEGVQSTVDTDAQTWKLQPSAT